MKKTVFLTTLLSLMLMPVMAQNNPIDISGDNTDKSYVSYTQTINVAAGKTVDVKMARYCYFYPTITGSGTLNLYGGGERCYLGTSKGASWPNWTGFTGNIHIYPFPENSSKAGFYGVVLAQGGIAFSPENVEDAIASGKVNNSMEKSHVTLHEGAVICCDQNSNGAGFRIGELNTEAGSTIRGYMKNDRPSYFLVGCLGTDATLAGTIASPGYSHTHLVGLIKEGKGTYRITGNNNYLTGALRVMGGRVLVMNDRAEAESKGLRGALGAKSNENEAIAYVFEKGVLGGTGSIGGSVDNYGTIEPGDDATGTLTLKNYTSTSTNSHLFVHPASVLRFKIASASAYDQLNVNGSVKYNNMMEDFSVGDKMPLIKIALDKDAGVKVGDEFVLLTAKSKAAGNWHFELKQPERYTWEISEKEVNGAYTVTLRLVSFNDPGAADDPEDPDNPDEQERMGAFYDDGINDQTDKTTLREYAEKNDKHIGTAITTWKNDITNESLAETKEIGQQFNMLVAENEMKWDAIEPSRNGFNYWGADNLVTFAQKNNMLIRGHCLAWHSQLPEWVSSDGKKNDRNWSREEALEILKTHITNVVKHYKGKVVEWDVVNECLSDDQTTVRTNPDGYDLRTSVWTRAIGEDFIDSAFVFAHRADPEALLYLNDYGVELQGKAKSAAFYNLAMRLKASDIPIDGVGLQCHFSTGDVDSVKLAKTIKRFAEAGLKCIITELDMGIPNTSTANLEEQARNYRVITDIVLNNDNCPNLVIWGLKDNNSWRESSSPLLYTAGVGKKPAYYAVRSALRHRAIQKETETSVEELSLNPQPSTLNSPWYTLSGMKLEGEPTQPGIYIKDGIKYVIQ